MCKGDQLVLLIGWISWYLIESRWIIKTNVQLIKSQIAGDHLAMPDSVQDKNLTFKPVCFSNVKKVRNAGSWGEHN